MSLSASAQISETAIFPTRRETTMTLRSLMTGATVALCTVAVLVLPAIHVRAQSGPAPFTINVQIGGFQPDPSSPFQVKGDFIGTGVWQTLTAPLLGPPFTSISGASGFTGSCQSEYGQHQIVTSDGSSLIAEVTGIRCVTAPGAHRTFGMYSPVGGTGRFQGITGGAGPITIDARADGSTTLFIAGITTGGGGHRTCTAGMCGG
jgi:hypothetical protein